MEISKRIEQIKKRFASPDSKLRTNADIIKKTKELRQWVDNGFKHTELKEQKNDIPFLTLKELEQRIIDDRKALFDKILLRK